MSSAFESKTQRKLNKYTKICTNLRSKKESFYIEDIASEWEYKRLKKRLDEATRKLLYWERRRVEINQN